MKRRTDNTIDEIAKWVAQGHAQSAANCRVLLDKIAEQAAEIKRLKERRDQRPLRVKGGYQPIEAGTPKPPMGGTSVFGPSTLNLTLSFKVP